MKNVKKQKLIYIDSDYRDTPFLDLTHFNDLDDDLYTFGNSYGDLFQTDGKVDEYFRDIYDSMDEVTGYLRSYLREMVENE